MPDDVRRYRLAEPHSPNPTLHACEATPIGRRPVVPTGTNHLAAALFPEISQCMLNAFAERAICGKSSCTILLSARLGHSMSMDVAAAHLDAGAAPLTGLSILQKTVIGAGIVWALAFVVVGIRYQLQMYGDGSVFSYGVAIGESWAVHWHNIAGRTAVYVFCLAPAEAYVRLTQDAAGGVALYGLLFFGAQAAGLAGTFILDRSARRIVFTAGCASTACLCPLVFGFPTEMWMAHAIFWPTLAVCHFARMGPTSFAAVLLALCALIFTHEGAVVLAVAIVATTLLHGRTSPVLLRAVVALLPALGIWAAVKLTVSPDEYFAPVLARAQRNFFDPHVFTSGVFAELMSVLAGFGLLAIILRRLGSTIANLCACLIVLAGLAAYWWIFAPAPHAENRYLLRTALVIATPCFGALAVSLALGAADRLRAPPEWVGRLLRSLRSRTFVGAAAAAFLIVTIVHTVEAARFVATWNQYTAAVRELATGAASDTALGDRRFVSSDRIASMLQTVSWSSATPFLSVLVAPNFSPTRLVVDPSANYFWLPCAFTRRKEITAPAVPAASLGLIRAYSCLHR